MGSSQEMYDPVNNSWAYAAPTSVARGGHQAVVLADGRVLIVGGRPSGHALASAELYNPSSNVTSAVAPMKVARFQFQAVLLGDNKVLVMGGYGNDANESALSSCEIYDPASDTWTAAADMAAKRGAFKAATLNDGSVMAVGGATAHFNAPALASAEIYSMSAATAGAHSRTWPARGLVCRLSLCERLVVGCLGRCSQPCDGWEEIHARSSLLVLHIPAVAESAEF